MTEKRSPGALAEGLRAQRPPEDKVALAAAEARIEQALFGTAEPTRVGRFVVRDPIAGGGMGVVYGAYDPELDRRVALKVLHPRQRGDARARDRLIAEARALAKLDDPNVVPLHDVLVADDQVILVMELVAGETVAAWERGGPRSWRAIVDVYRQAGRGLAAAHRLGLVHRDFKPANAIIGTDGRVRVLDFGLARVDDGTDHALAAAPAASADPTHTATGELVGTVGFMAPEQLAGETATAASDQFSFCVALYRALAGTAPFAGHDAASRLASIRAGAIAAPARGRRIPGWLRGLVARGLRPAPADRHESMAALLDQLDRERGWRRWRGAIAVAALIAIAGVAVAGRRRDPGAIDDGAREVAAVWSPDRRAQLRAALARVGTPYADEIRDRVVLGLDDYGLRWRLQRRHAIVAHRIGEESADLLDRRMLCLRARLDDLGSAVEVLTRIDRASVTNAMDVVAQMRPIADCADAAALMTAPPPVALRAQVARVRAELSHADALRRAGRSAEALGEAEAAHASAEPVAYPPVRVEAALLHGRILLERDQRVAAIAPLTAAEHLAFESGQYARAVEAGARRLYCESVEGRDLEGFDREVAILEPLGRGLAHDHFAYPLLLNNLGVASMALHDRDAAYRYFERAHQALDGVALPDLELNVVALNLAMLERDGAKRERLAAEAWQRLHDELAPQHLAAIDALYRWGSYTGDPAAARRRFQEAYDQYTRFHPELIALRAQCGYLAAFTTAELGDAAAAADGFAAVAALTAGSTDPETARWGELAAGYAALHRDDPRTALARFTPVITDVEARAEWWARKYAAFARLGAGLAAQRLDDARVAIVHLDHAIAAFTELTAMNEEVVHHDGLAQARRARAELSAGQERRRPTP